MGEQGFFARDERVELIKGYPEHAAMVRRLTMLFTGLFRETQGVRGAIPSKASGERSGRVRS